jgi:hypothetical protein
MKRPRPERTFFYVDAIIGHRVLPLICELRDWIEYKRTYSDQDTPEAAKLGRAWHDHKVRVREAGKQ